MGILEGADLLQVALCFRATCKRSAPSKIPTTVAAVWHYTPLRNIKGQQIETAFVGVGDRKARLWAEIFVLEGFQNDGRGGGGPEGLFLLSNQSHVSGLRPKRGGKGGESDGNQMVRSLLSYEALCVIFYKTMCLIYVSGLWPSFWKELDLLARV